MESADQIHPIVAIRQGSETIDPGRTCLLFGADSSLCAARSSGRMNFAVLLPTGVSLRNFAFGPFVPLLSGHGEVRVWHGAQAEEASIFQQEGSAAAWYALRPFSDTATASILRCSMGYAHLYHG